MTSHLRPTAFATRLLLASLAAGAALTLATPPAAAQAAAARSYSIPAGALGPALTRFAAEANVVLSFTPSAVAGRSTPGLAGSYTPEQGLAQLLRGSGWGVGRSAAGFVLVPDAPPAEPAPAAARQLPQVTVSAQAERESAWGPVRGLVARRSATATKTDTPLLETPQSISVVTADQMATLQSQSLGEALAYTPGVLAVAGYSKSYDNFKSRGFALRDDSGSVLRDGLKFGGSGWATGQQEPYGLERVELLKGASSVLYGAAAPGGVLNTVSKRPGDGMVQELRVGIGTLGHREVAADLGGAFASQGDWSWRLTALVRKGHTHVDFTPGDSSYVAPALRWQPSAATSLTLLAWHHERHTAYYYPLPAEGTLVPNANGRLPRNRFVGEPGFDREDSRQWALGWTFEHALSDATKLRHAARFIDSENHVRFTGLDGWVDASQREQFRSAYDEVERTSGWSTDTSVEHRFSAGSTVHTLLAGLDASRLQPSSQWSLASLAPLDLFAPAYGAVPGAMAVVPSYTYRTVQQRAGLYLQDQVKIGSRWVLVAGGRHDWTRNAQSPAAGATAWSTERADAFTGRLGAVYLADGGFAPFVSFSESFQPQAGVDHAGRRFKPTTGEQLELGVRWQPAPEGLLLSAAVYDLRQQNVVTRNPAAPAQRLQQGEVRARGFELEAKGPVARRVNLVAAYAYTDARTSRSLDPAEVGARVDSLPYHQASAWIDADLGAWVTPGLRAGLGVRYTGSYPDVKGTGAKVPAAAVVDAMLGYATGPWTFTLNVANLGDRTVLACSYGSCTYGEGRRLTGNVAYRW